MNLPSLETIGGNLDATENRTLNFPKLRTVGGDIVLVGTGLAHLPPKLEHVGGNAFISSLEPKSLLLELLAIKEQGILKGEIFVDGIIYQATLQSNAKCLPPISRAACGDLLARWLEKSSDPDVVKQLVKETGYNDSPFFGAEKKKIKIVGELLIVNTALGIFAVNQVFGHNDAKAIIDAFLAVAEKYVFGYLEKKDAGFKQRYEQRMGQYFKVLLEEKPALGMSFSFMTNLGLDPLKNMQGQILVAARLGQSLSQTLDVLKRLTLVPGNA